MSSSTSHLSSSEHEVKRDGPSKTYKTFLLTFGVFFILLSLAYIAVGICAIYFAKEKDCDNIKLKIWLYVEGGIMILGTLSACCEICVIDEETSSGSLAPSGTLNLAWLIVGTIFIETHDQICSDFLYDFMKGTIIALWCLYGIGFVGAICIYCGAAM